MHAPTTPLEEDISPREFAGGLYRWDQPGVPHKGWTAEHVEDHEEPVFQCEMCGNPAVRYVHVMVHPEWPGELRVGCICAGRMEENYAAARDRERQARNRAQRRQRLTERHDRARRLWVQPERWRVSGKGNFWRWAGGVRVTVFRSEYPPHAWRGWIGDELGQLRHPSAEAAMAAMFARLFPLKHVQPRVRLPGERGYDEQRALAGVR
jgi:hypothetical protein